MSMVLAPKELGFTEETAKLVNTKWLLNVLSTLNPNHRYFAKDFVCSPEEKRNTDHL